MRLVIAGMIVIGMVLVAVVLIWLSWFGSRQIMLEVASVVARDAGRVTAERTRGIAAPGAAALRVLVFDPLLRAGSLDERLARRPPLLALLRENPLASAFYVGYDNGDFMAVLQLDEPSVRQSLAAPRGASYMVHSVDGRARGELRHEYLFFSDQDVLLERRELPGPTFDPRGRPWYAAALVTSGTATSGPYAFVPTHKVGISLSRAGGDGKAVVGLDIALEDLGKSQSDLRTTPRTELALVSSGGVVIGYRDIAERLARHAESQVTMLTQHVGESAPQLLVLDELGVEPLMRLWQVAEGEDTVFYRAAGDQWLGVSLPFDGIDGLDLRLLIAAPVDELLGTLARNRLNMILIACGLIVLSLPLGWWAGSAVGQALERLTVQAQRMSRFDFRRPAQRAALLRETGELNDVMDHVGGTVEAFLAISHVLGTEPRIETMLAKVLEKLVNATRCAGGAVYLFEEGSDGLPRVAAFGEQDGLYEIRPLTGQAPPEGGPYTHITFDLRGRRGRLEGVLVLVHARDRDHASPEFQAFTGRLTGMLAVAIEFRQLIEEQQALFDAVIRVLADAIDAKSPYTGEHCERVPHLAMMLADRMAAETSGSYANFRLDGDERYEFYLAAWLHDCGKVTSPEHIVDKATKLEVIYNRIHEIRMRFEALWRDARIDYLQTRLDGGDERAAAALCEARQARLQDDFRFIAQCNIGSEFLADEAVERLRRIGEQTWLRHFDDSLGLSAEEVRRRAISGVEPATLPAVERLLADRPEHRVSWEGMRRPAVERDDPNNALGFDMKLPAHRQHLGELHNLAVRRGTLTEEDRFAVNEHIVQTLAMLKKLPWPAHLSRVPDIAANHHEKMDGTGYPRRLSRSELHTTERIMALVDVFEALTAAGRPYKPPKTLSESLRIMAAMCRDQHLDAELYLYFLHSGIWLEYGREFMTPAQIDAVDVEALARLARAPRETMA